MRLQGKFLGTSKNLDVWKQTLRALNTAEGHPDMNERLWAKLRASFDGLEDTLQQMFLDAATFIHSGAYYPQRTRRTLGDMKVAWQAAYTVSQACFGKTGGPLVIV